MINMKLLIILILALLSSKLFAWTQVTNGDYFDSGNVDIHIATDDCSAGGLTTSKYERLIEGAVENYWNEVPTSSINLSVEGISSNISISGDDFDAAIVKAPKNSILAGCNTSAFNPSTDAGTLGAAAISCQGSGCRGILILNLNSNSGLSTLDDDEIEATIAHEIGHALGLGHSEYKYNLMYYSISGKYQKWLGMDDVNGISYLYPNESEFDVLGISLLGACSSINLDGNGGNSPLIFGLAFLFTLMLGFIRRLRAKH